jgi:hypothetical protein
MYDNGNFVITWTDGRFYYDHNHDPRQKKEYCQTIFITAGKTLYRTNVPDVGEVAYPIWNQLDAGGRE